ncbi:hypothetical protein NN4_42350 [Nocardia ninae NBRC 108245]|uniref:Uncharacterized protein n=1 Tax=Nocardia ninae NBRC 108245 TaxID=1210091 RepID=A0A511MIG9_9NOCA|nr:hypothetical protein NN4_42350 [Nocardia ninae NBRC 108245]
MLPRLRCAPLLKELFNEISCFPDIFVFPDSYDCPACLDQSTGGFVVACLIADDFFPPELLVSRSGPVVVWASMPEAPVDEHRDSVTVEHKICPPSEFWYRSRVNPVAQAALV